MYNINPFDEPNVTESKNNTKRLLEEYVQKGKLPESEPFISGESVKLFAGENTLKPLRELCAQHRYDATSRTELLAAQITGTKAGDYFAILAYLPQTKEINDELQDVRLRLRKVTRRAATLGYGPRYLHSTGQLHKGGPNNGVFLLLTADIKQDIAIPDAPYSFGTLMMAQALGDMEALQSHGCRVIRVHIHDDVMGGIYKLLAAIDFVENRHQ
jgi:hypothetical protein